MLFYMDVLVCKNLDKNYTKSDSRMVKYLTRKTS